jgi:type II secretory pathway component PulC
MRRRSRTSNLLSLALALCGVGLAAFAYAELRMEVDDEPIAAVPDRADAAEAAAKPEPFTLPPLAELQEVVQRPLFSESRRPPAVVPASTPQVVRELDSLSLLGVVITPDDRHALIQSDPQGKPERVHQGQALAGWTVEGILPDRVVFRRGETREELRIKEPEHPPNQ